MQTICTLAQLLDAVREGKIERVWIDNDNVSGESGDPDQSGPAEIRFQSHPQKLLEECLSLLQIPWEHV